ncbi:glucose 1-dehydrogenase [uncultured Nostoc sp.]|uniref:SDR family NAD(P)-dependent oxidoreductase n=1 Tax=uncultured Nostoc sp. TaxID=340711 RepID=UPI00261032A7|nr:glucose 1-dehydrogenase [uncultured Nostoc sp.]
MKLNGKIAVVTGASRGIGKAIATRLASEGAIVAINYREDAKPAEALVSELNSKGFKAEAFRADVSKPTECHTLLDDVAKTFGRVDILVSNAGIEHFGKLEEITAQDFERVFSVNVAGQLFVTQAASRYLPSGGRIVLTSSVSAQISIFHHTLYAASKAAVSAMVLNLAPELGERGITINAIAPGGTATDMAKENGKLYTHPALQNVSLEALLKSKASLQRLAQPEEIAAAVTFLVSDDASYVTGSTLAVDGGRL